VTRSEFFREVLRRSWHSAFRRLEAAEALAGVSFYAAGYIWLGAEKGLKLASLVTLILFVLTVIVGLFFAAYGVYREEFGKRVAAEEKLRAGSHVDAERKRIVKREVDGLKSEDVAALEHLLVHKRASTSRLEEVTGNYFIDDLLTELHGRASFVVCTGGYWEIDPDFRTALEQTIAERRGGSLPA
jgi:hypothetical protein